MRSSQKKFDVKVEPEIDSDNSRSSEENDDIMNEKIEEEINKKIENIK